MMFMNDMVGFALWLDENMKVREWSQSEMGRRAGVDRQIIWNYLNQKVSKPDEEILKKIAKAFKLPPEQVYRVAGLLPPVRDPDETAEQILYETHDLTKQEKEEVLAFIRMKKNLRKKNGH